MSTLFFWRAVYLNRSTQSIRGGVLILCLLILAPPNMLGDSPAPASSFWGIDACLTRHVDEAGFQRYLLLLKGSGIRWLRERDVGVRTIDGSYQSDIRPRLKAEKAAGFLVDAFATLPKPPPILQTGDSLPEDLISIFHNGALLARDFSGLVDSWELLAEPDIGYCLDLPDRAIAYQKALYLGIKSEPYNRGVSGSSADRPLVLMGALALPPGRWLERAVKNDLLDYSDGYNFHFYGDAKDLAGVIAAHQRVASKAKLPLWITECGLNAMPEGAFMDKSRRLLQSEFTRVTSLTAMNSKDVAVFMPFILVLDQSPFALTLNADRPFPAWNTYHDLVLTHLVARHTAPPSGIYHNPIVLQWLPDNRTTEPHKVSGSYRFIGTTPITGVLNIYNFSGAAETGKLKFLPLHAIKLSVTVPRHLEIPSMGVIRIPMEFARKDLAYFNEPWSATFLDNSGRRSITSFAFEAKPSDDCFIQSALTLSRLQVPSRPMLGAVSQDVSGGSGPWIALNGLKIESTDGVLNSGHTTPIRIWADSIQTDPLKPALVAAQISKIPSAGFIRLQTSQPFSRQFAVRIDLYDKQGHGFTIWENFGASYSDPNARDFWLNLRDFHPAFWSPTGLNPSPRNIERIELRVYLARLKSPVDLSLSIMEARDLGKTTEK